MASSDIDTLFQLPLADFTAARNALAARLKKEGRSDEAADVKALTKPSVSAWVANQLYWRHPKLFERLVARGEEMRRAQSAQLTGKKSDVREAVDARREALADLTREAAATLASASHNPSPEMMRRISTTLEALSIYGNAPGAPQPGRLTEDVDPPGFETLAALMPGSGTSKGRGSTTVIPFQRRAPKTAPKPPADEKEARALEREREAQRAAAVKQAERDLREAKNAAERAEAALKKAAARVKAAEAARADAERQLEEAASELTAAKTASRQIAAEAEEAAQAVSDAERALESLT